MTLDAELVERFCSELDRLIERDSRVGIAVSGGPDSVALLLLASEARPGKVEAATVDHGLRPESRAEADMVANVCAGLGVPHAVLATQWDQAPITALQERAREMRYRLLGEWARERGLAAIITAHHLDDQAETLLMRLARGVGVRGLAGMREVTHSADGTTILRPLLNWTHDELEAVCADAGVRPAQDPSNHDPRFERVRVRTALASADPLDPRQLAASASHLAEAEDGLEWATDREWERGATAADGEILYRPADAPSEIRRRIVRRAVLALASEGSGADLRGRELDRLLADLSQGGRSTLRGVLCTGGGEWRFVKAPARRG